jgi:TetR/AcrR family transcriptional regulator, transcriptional repressor of bet genes
MLPADHDERRRRIAEVTVEVIAREGLEAATIRRIAKELGGPTKIVTHYFPNKHELLVWAYQSLAEQGQRNVNNVIARDPTDIVGSLFAMTAAEESGVLLWRVFVAFWDRSVRDSVIAELQRMHMDLAIERIAEIVRARNGERGDLQSVSQRLNALVQGISFQALIDKDRWSAERIRNTLADEVEVVLGRTTTTTTT